MYCSVAIHRYLFCHLCFYLVVEISLFARLGPTASRCELQYICIYVRVYYHIYYDVF